MRKIIIAGGTGFLGSILIRHFKETKTQLIILTRGNDQVDSYVKYVQWNAKTEGSWVKELENADAVINLNGKSVDCRYTKKNKRLIYSTRLDSTAAIGTAIQHCENPPAVWINASSATLYRHSIDKEMDEYTGEVGTGFSVDVCKQWEQMFNSCETKKTRKILLRTGMVFGKSGGPLKPLKMLSLAGVGGKQGNGDQYVSWLHETDFAKIIDFLLADIKARGAYNVTAPTPVVNSHLMTSLNTVLGVPMGLPLPKWLLEFGAALIGTETELILKSRRVVPKRLLDDGYRFEFNSIEDALSDLCR